MEGFDPSITGVTADHPQNEAIHTTLACGNLHAIHGGLCCVVMLVFTPILQRPKTHIAS